ncbi:MAG: tetratricopeptide repeat protein, partial [Pseudomonadota bacterium]|nr:tetratricopeptide repeat protein [Pseudomonadota bacterium]
MKKLFAVVVLASASAFAWAVPSLQQVEAEVSAGRYTQAESMLAEVVAEKGNSAKAHYIYAEVLAHNGKFPQAADEARRARQIDPDIKFTSADKFRAFEQTLQREQQTGVSRNSPPVVANRAAPVERSSGMPSWIWIAALAAIAFVLWRGFA